jgi:hypothetical protein
MSGNTEDMLENWEARVACGKATEGQSCGQEEERRQAGGEGGMRARVGRKGLTMFMRGPTGWWGEDAVSYYYGQAVLSLFVARGRRCFGQGKSGALRTTASTDPILPSAFPPSTGATKR